ncbi:hypothetical protein [Streptomyces yaizuensis]|uniref:Uncharacterized protein n=1 Tax=Streptomyces yaizuensis TaxID=2989713 RepID=A0ABQ5NW11_9ACTN|nr:hypothetical protein [Streptomyces sp. YSPA8]GLF94404.1 hypothetical protein SYYSPA8_08925 [Streptomyces sp. YSPA8]
MSTQVRDDIGRDANGTIQVIRCPHSQCRQLVQVEINHPLHHTDSTDETHCPPSGVEVIDIPGRHLPN